MDGKKSKEERVVWPVGTLLTDLEKAFGRKSPFYVHMTQARVEFLKGVRSLLDDRIEHLEKKRAEGGGKKMTKIKVE